MSKIKYSNMYHYLYVYIYIHIYIIFKEETWMAGGQEWENFHSVFFFYFLVCNTFIKSEQISVISEL